MSVFDNPPRIDLFIKRGVDILKNTDDLFPSGYPPDQGDNLVTDVLDQEPPITQSSMRAVMPVIFVGYSRNPNMRQQSLGRSSRDVKGAILHHLEFYTVIMVREITKEKAWEKAEQISTIVQKAFNTNIRMTKPSDSSDPYCMGLETIPVPYVFRTNETTIAAINVMVRPQFPNSLR